MLKGVIVPNDEAWIYEWYDVECVCPKDISEALDKAMGEDIEVEINSGGGDVYSGSEIYTALSNYKGKVTTKIVGIAASAASVVSQAGIHRSISPTAQIMIHNVAEVAWGDYRVFEHEAEVLKNYNISIANAYRLKTNLSEQELLELMNKETWLNAQQAKEKGFVDEILFDTERRLAASTGKSGLLPPEVIKKMRNLKPELFAQVPNDDSNKLKIAKANLNLLKLKGEFINEVHGLH
jgi:ATP-dependent protease ClpP protease subunit